jgi:intein/homing endonuclease
MLTKYASFEVSEVLDVKGSANRSYSAKLDKLSDFHDYRTGDGYLYVRIRAISSRVNKNNDGWPSVELAGSPEIFERYSRRSSTGFTIEASEGDGEFGFATFLGKPVFVDHHNSDPKDARGVIIDAKLKVLPIEKEAALDSYYSSKDVDPEHMPPTEVELLLEVDAKSFPKLAKAIRSGDIDGFSMGCFVAGTPITLEDGTKKPIEAITVGDEVLTHTGKVQQVTSTMTREYEGDIYKIHVYGQNNPLALTSEHPVWIKRSLYPEWIKAEDIKTGDYVLTPRFQKTVNEAANGWPTLVGYYLAEGNLGYDKKRYPDGRPVFVEWNFHVNETRYVQEIEDSLRQINYKPVGPYVKHNCQTIRCNSPELASSFLATAGQHSWGKKLAPHVLDWGPSSQKLLLDAYFRGDGHERRCGRVEISTASKDLANQIQVLCNRTGYRMTPPTKQHSPSAKHKRPKYSMYITTGSHDKDPRFWIDSNVGLWRKVTKVTSKHKVVPVYNFEVKGDNSYVANDVAVHNCDVDYSKCSHCGHIASSPEEYCSHIKMKGAHHDFKTADGKRVSRKSYENCLTPDTPILLADNNYVPIYDIQKGMSIIDHLGESRKVLSTHKRNISETILEIHRSGQGTDRPLRVTSNHPLLIVQGKKKDLKNGSFEPEFIEAGQLSEGDWVVETSPRHKGLLKTVISPRITRYLHKDIPEQIELSEDFGRWCGWYLAEGSISYNRLASGERSESSVVFGLHREEISEQEEILNLGEKIFGIDGKIEVRNNSASISFHNRPLAVLMSQLGTSSITKALPHEWLDGPIQFINGVVGAHRSGDGHQDEVSGYRPNEMLHSTSSSVLADQLYDMNIWLGHTPNRRWDKPLELNKRTVPGNIIVMPAKRQRTARGRIETDQWRLSKITSIDQVKYTGPVYNLEVADTHTYIANGQAVHNCYGIKFFEISAVFDPADPTALAREIRAGVQKEAVVDGLPDPIPGRQDADDIAVEQRAQEIMDRMYDSIQGPYTPEQAIAAAQVQLGVVPKGIGKDDREPFQVKRWDYTFPGQIPPAKSQNFEDEFPAAIPDTAGPLHGIAEEMFQNRYPEGKGRPVRNDPRWGSVKYGENPLPQSFDTSAPERIDTMRQEQLCPVCGQEMDGEECAVCGYVRPPKGFGNPDLTRAKEIQQEMQQGDMEASQPQQPEQGIPSPQEQPKQPGSYLQKKTRNPMSTASVMSDMRWQPKISARINKGERPIKQTSKPATNEPTTEIVTSNPITPVTSAMKTAQELIDRAKQNHTGDTMSIKTADGPTAPDASPDTRVDVTGVGGVIEPSNEAASKADAQVDVKGVGGTGVEGVEADSTTTLPTASEDGDDSGFNTDKTTQDSGPTSTYGDSDGTEKAFTDPVTTDVYPSDGKESAWAATHQAYDAKPFYDQPGLSGGSANQGTQPVDAVGKADDRVDVLDATTTPENNSGPTKTWSGTDGNGVYKQQDPVTKDLVWNNTDNAWTSHIVSAMKVADMEVDLGLIGKDDKYTRIAELESQTDDVLAAQRDTLANVKTAGLNKLAQARTAGVTRMPSLFGQATAAPNGFERVAREDQKSPQIDEDVLDSALFGR